MNLEFPAPNPYRRVEMLENREPIDSSSETGRPKVCRRSAWQSSYRIRSSTLCRCLCGWRGEPDVELKVFYCCDWGVRQYADPGFGKSIAWDIPLLDGYDFQFLAIKRRPKSLGFFDIDNPLVAERLTAFAPDAVWVHG